uniref:Zinc finger, MYND-type containing 8 n=1 Tax=Cyprinus carpio TaxID=7962 RepID=A0A8C1L2J2_CYPCA
FSHCGSLAEGGGKESDAIEGMEIATRSKVSDQGSAERTIPKRKVSSPPHSSNGHSPSETSSSPVKKKKKPGAVNNSKDQSELRHGPFYYVKQPALTTDPVDVVPQDGRNDFYCWVCHREGQVLCCELCPRVYHAKCLKLAAEPEGDWFCPECEKITVAECIETQSKAMTMLTLDQLSFLLKFALQKMKQPGTEPFQKPVSLEQHPDYAEYIFHPMDLCTLEKNIKKKMYGSTEAFLADVKWILHNCIIYNGGNHKLTATAKVIVKICEHESNPHPLVWAKLKGFPFWPAKALRDKDGQVDARFFGQHDRAWVPINNCYLMSKEIPFSVKKTKSIFNSAMQEMEVYVENIRKKFGVFNYAPFRTPYTPDNQFQMLLDPANPSAGSVKPEKQEKIKFSFDVTASPKLLVGKSMVSSGNVGGGTGRRISMSDMPRSPMSTNSSAHTGSDGEQETAEKGHARAALPHYNTGEESVDCTAGLSGNTLESPKPFHSSAPSTPVKQEKTPTTGSILNLNLDRSKAEMDLKELSESVQQQQQQGAQPSLTSPKRQIRSRFQLNLDKTIESCKAQLGIDEISEDVYKGVEHSDSEESDKSDSSDSEYGSDDEQKSKSGQDDKNTVDDKTEKEPPKKKAKPSVAAGEDKDSSTESAATATTATKGEPSQKTSTSEPIAKDKPGIDSEKESPASPDSREKPKSSEEAMPPASVDVDSDSERELVIDLGEEQAGKERKRNRKDSAAVTALKEPTASKPEGKATPISSSLTQPQNSTVLSSSPTVKDPSQSPLAVPLNIIPLTAAPTSTTLTSSTLPITTPSTANSSSPISTNTVKKQRPLLPRETVPVVQQAVVWNPTTKFQTSSQKWHMQKVHRQQQGQTQPATQAQVLTQVSSSSSGQQPSSSTRYQTRQSVKTVQQKDSSSSSSSTSTTGDFQIPTTSADVAADIAKYTNKIMDAIKGTMTEIYNDLSKSTSGNTIAEIRRLRIEIEKLQWLHQQELSEMKHNLELTMAEMRQSLEQERERIVTEVKKQMEVEKQQAVDETKKKQWCANCRKEAIFYCCWNTSYCDYPCQQAHWPEHMKSCTQSATSSQQEQESESSIDVTPKAPGQPNNSPRETVSATPADKDSEVDKAKDSVAVTMS